MKKLYHHPKDGETRWDKRFAWFPEAVEDQLIWLRTYYVKQYYIKNYGDLRLYEDGWWKDCPFPGYKEL